MTTGFVALAIPDPILIAVVLAAIAAAWIVFIYNRLVRDRNLMREAWSGIDVQLRRRHNLIPNLVETVKGYSAHEKSVFEDIARTRTESEKAVAVKDRETSENALSQALRGLFAVAEQYPDLKANTNFLGLQSELVKVEDQLQMARRYYNGAVRNYNIRVESFPGNVVAGTFGFAAADFFELEGATEREAPKVEMAR